ncbi:MAG: type II toxin-antitoxin system VapB family antitoxin [Hyphomicrobiales bacterium]|nr:type II toxin-antitoxin system VapB family antitoxin [Hyphomicrobiales bacterium]
MIELSPETEALVQAKAMTAGRTPDEIVRAALSRTGDVLPWRSPAIPRPPAEKKDEPIAAMEEIAARSAARPLVDPRSPDEIIGYDDFGLPR